MRYNLLDQVDLRYAEEAGELREESRLVSHVPVASVLLMINGQRLKEAVRDVEEPHQGL